MKRKRGVVCVSNNTTEAIERAFEESCRKILGPDFEPECTSGIEGNHSTESGHYYGRAEDFGFHGFSRTTGKRIVIPISKRSLILNDCQGRLNNELSPAKYLVILESNHFHIQRDKQSF